MQILLIRRAKEPAKGQWCFPGGSLELGGWCWSRPGGSRLQSRHSMLHLLCCLKLH